jgi:hypothetical protein
MHRETPFNINIKTNNEKLDHKTDIVYVGVISGRGESE